MPNVTFDHAAGAELDSALADALSKFIVVAQDRATAAARARDNWEGVHRDEFDLFEADVDRLLADVIEKLIRARRAVADAREWAVREQQHREDAERERLELERRRREAEQQRELERLRPTSIPGSPAAPTTAPPSSSPPATPTNIPTRATTTTPTPMRTTTTTPSGRAA